ncbi:hypothetical protein [Marinimicrobium agarilyticum]|uniref:hypothetical protein n=1 Tax=Marinimicrobium agarilyticum TaxID=306546 RepID=UPI000412F899|nr:hypothetical protein [Marinimicrobium agarilyticum]
MLEELIDIASDQVREGLIFLSVWAKQSKVLLPIFLSVFSAIIFWLSFSYIPERKRRKKLRPIVELSLFDVYSQLFSLFDLLMRHSSSSPSFFQKEIRSGKLSEDDIHLGLQNKCLNESYLYDANIRNSFLVVGEEILGRALDIDELANKVLSFHTYATAEELVLLENIREKIRAYDFNGHNVKRPCGTTINGHVLLPVNPSISYRYRNFYELYEFFCRLQKIVLNHKPLDRNRFIYKMQWLYHSGQYRLCVKLIKSQGSLFEKNPTLCMNYLALSERGRGRIKAFYRIVEDTYKSKPSGGSLISSRSTFAEIIGDDGLIDILARFYSSEEISALRESVKKDIKHKEEFESANRALAEYLGGK